MPSSRRDIGNILHHSGTLFYGGLLQHIMLLSICFYQFAFINLLLSICGPKGSIDHLEKLFLARTQGLNVVKVANLDII